MDAIDKNILTDLMINCRTTYQEMAKKYNLSANAIKKRINNMISKGVIENFTIQLSLKMIGAELLMSIVQSDGSEDEEKFIDEIGNDPRFGAVGKASGNIYVSFARYLNGTIGLNEIRLFFSRFTFLKSIEIFPLLVDRGGKMELSRTSLLILKRLLENPRMPVSEISNKTGISSRMVSSTINDLIEQGIVQLSITYSPGTDSILFLAKIEYDDKKVNLNDLLIWFPSEFPDEYWIPAGISATNPIIFLAFITNSLNSIKDITQALKKHPSIKSVTPIIGQPNKTFTDYSVIKLKELVNNIK